MQFEIHNFGLSKTIPYRDKSIVLARHASIYTDNADIAKALSGVHEITVKPDPHGGDAKALTRWEMMRKLKHAGIEVYKTDTNEDLIRKLDSKGVK